MYDFIDEDFFFPGRPAFKTRAVYVNTIFDQPPLCATYWPFYRWKEFIDLSVKLRLNRFDIFLWPSAKAWDGSYNMMYSRDEKTQIPKSLKQVELFKKVLSYAKENGMSTFVGYSMHAATMGIAQKNRHLLVEAKDGEASRCRDRNGEELFVTSGSIGGEKCLLCWNKPGAKEILLDIAKEQIETYKADGYWLCPFDLGGCWCQKCQQDYSRVITDQVNSHYTLIKTIRPNARVSLLVWWWQKWGVGPTERREVIRQIPKDISLMFPHDLSAEFMREETVEFARQEGHEVLGWVTLDMNHKQPFPSPCPLWIGEAIKIAKEEGASGASCYLHTPATKLENIYLYARLLWNPTLDVEQVLIEFANKFYGKDVAKDIPNVLRIIEEYWTLPGKSPTAKSKYDPITVGKPFLKGLELLEEAIEVLERLKPKEKVGAGNLRDLLLGIRIRYWIDKSVVFTKKARRLYKEDKFVEANRAWEEEVLTYRKACNEASGSIYDPMLAHYNLLDNLLDEMIELPPWNRAWEEEPGWAGRDQAGRYCDRGWV